jgi:dihydropyrimidinase
MANGLPGIELRMALLFSEGVLTGRMPIERFVALCSTNHARTYGLFPRKGAIAVGSDADLALWDPTVKRVVRAELLHDKAGYTPYEGRTITGWPTTVISRGRVAVQDNRLLLQPGDGELLACGTPEPVARQRLNGNPNSVRRKFFT